MDWLGPGGSIWAVGTPTVAGMAGLAVATAWWLDARFGEPPNALHPVAWLGHLLGPLGARLVRWPAGAAFVGGAAAWWLITAALGWAAAAVESALLHPATAPAHPGLRALAGAAACGALFKPCFAWRMLRDEVLAVDHALAHSLQAGRDQVARLASRDVRALDAPGVRETAIETLAENLNDSVVAPLFWFALAGLPGAVVYRFANTCDAMWGYRGRFEWAGKWAAWADDGLSWLPARITAALLAPRWMAAGHQRLRQEAAHTPSPNGGWPMAAMALQLRVRLRKPGVYALNAAAPSPGATHHAQALQRAAAAARMAVCWAVPMAMLLTVLRGMLLGWAR